jgi:hypothetical protein
LENKRISINIIKDNLCQPLYLLFFILWDPGDPDDEHYRDGGGPGHPLRHRLPELLGLQEQLSPY